MHFHGVSGLEGHHEHRHISPITRETWPASSRSQSVGGFIANLRPPAPSSVPTWPLPSAIRNSRTQPESSHMRSRTRLPARICAIVRPFQGQLDAPLAEEPEHQHHETYLKEPLPQAVANTLRPAQERTPHVHIQVLVARGSNANQRRSGTVLHCVTHHSFRRISYVILRRMVKLPTWN